MTPSAELVDYLARRLVEHDDQVSVEEVEEDGDLVIRLHVAPDDLGRVIGRGGRIARALRTLVRAGGAHGNRRVLLEIVE
ncbi:MAG TPA: KH domain-containing protein [Gaiellaceae bacterium]|nr:KH domain-containing protein [Gaiellaceae bacterium]